MEGFLALSSDIMSGACYKLTQS